MCASSTSLVAVCDVIRDAGTFDFACHLILDERDRLVERRPARRRSRALRGMRMRLVARPGVSYGPSDLELARPGQGPGSGENVFRPNGPAVRPSGSLALPGRPLVELDCQGWTTEQACMRAGWAARRWARCSGTACDGVASRSRGGAPRAGDVRSGARRLVPAGMPAMRPQRCREERSPRGPAGPGGFCYEPESDGSRLGKLCTGRRAGADGWLSHEEASGEPAVGLLVAAREMRGTGSTLRPGLRERTSPAAAAVGGGPGRDSSARRD